MCKLAGAWSTKFTASLRESGKRISPVLRLRIPASETSRIYQSNKIPPTAQPVTGVDGRAEKGTPMGTGVFSSYKNSA
jgi:hypothetical protein